MSACQQSIKAMEQEILVMKQSGNANYIEAIQDRTELMQLEMKRYSLNNLLNIYIALTYGMN